MEQVNSVKSVVTYFKHSVKGSDKLREEQIGSGIPPGQVQKLISDVITRWNSKYLMLDRFVELYRFIVAAAAELPECPPVIFRRDLEYIKECVDLLEPLKQVTDEVSGEHHVTGSKLIPLVNCMKNALNKMNVSSEMAIELKEHLVESINKRFGAIEQMKLLAISAIFDPRFKRLHFNSPVHCASALTSINNEMKDLIDKNKEPGSQTGEDSESTTERPPKVQKTSIWSLHNQLFASAATNFAETSGGLLLPLKQYLQMPLMKKEEDPLAYWKAGNALHPELSSLATKYLCIVGSSVPSERLFSKTGNLITEKRNRLDPKRVDRLIVMSNLTLQEWNNLD